MATRGQAIKLGLFLDVGAKARVMGARVGTVSDVRLARGATQVVVEIAVRRGTPISRDAVAYLRAGGLTQLREVDIEQRDPTRPLLHPGDTIPYRRGAIDELADQAGAIARSTTLLLDRANQLVDEAIATVRGLEQAPGALAALRKAADQLGGAARQVRSLVSENRPAARAALAGLAETADGATETLRRLDATLARIDSAADQLTREVRGSGGEARAALHAMKLAARELEDLSRELRRSPSRLLFSRPPRDREVP